MREAINLISRPSPRTVPLGGGTLLSHQRTESLEVVDLQALGLDRISAQGNFLEIGATATLESLLEHRNCPPALKAALKLEAPLNLRSAATIAGTLVTCDGRSTFGTVMLALDAKLSRFAISPGADAIEGATATESLQSLGDFLALRARVLITKITIPLQARLAFEYVSRSPSDKPIVCTALAQWPSGRSRLAVGGFGASPRLAMDGTGVAGLDAAARNALYDSTDEWGSADYRMEVAATLALRCLAAFSS
jgi:CO/xanthine dehydrogenase FAD-binding subunit